MGISRWNFLKIVVLFYLKLPFISIFPSIVLLLYLLINKTLILPCLTKYINNFEVDEFYPNNEIFVFILYKYIIFFKYIVICVLYSNFPLSTLFNPEIQKFSILEFTFDF